MREFSLTNAKGRIWSLNETNAFLHDIKGLGQEHKVTYVQVGTDFVKEKDYLSQKTITGKIKFTGYQEYQNFSEFIQHKPLVLTYESNGRYSLNVSIDKLGKTELTTLGLVSDISIKGLGTYYKTVVKENLREDNSKDGKIYPSSYPYQYFDVAKGVVIVDSDSVLESPVKINIFGPTKNPSYTHYVNGKVEMTGKVNASIQEGNKLVIDTTTIPYTIAEYTIDNEYVQDLYGKSDFSTERFVLLKNGENKISFVHEISEPITMSVEAYLKYESV